MAKIPPFTTDRREAALKRPKPTARRKGTVERDKAPAGPTGLLAPDPAAVAQALLAWDKQKHRMKLLMRKRREAEKQAKAL